MITREQIEDSKYFYHEDRIDARFLCLNEALRNVTIPMYLEFGVDTGFTINYIAKLINSRIYGFDSFYGLPEDWIHGFPNGTFNRDGELPFVLSNVILIPGMFEDTLPDFVKNNNYQYGFIHIDCDLYSSTKTVLDLLEPNIREGTVIAFDEMINFTGHEDHELKAFNEFLSQYSRSCNIICHNNFEQVVIKIN